MRYLLNFIYLTLILLISPWLLYRSLTTGRYREGWGHKLFGLVPRRQSDQPCLWLHAVSVGEVLQIEPLVLQWAQQHPNWQIAISTTTQTGMQVARKTYPQAILFYCPLDFTWAIRNTLKRLRPSCLGLVELELWPNLIGITDASNIPVALLNGRLSENSHRGYKRFRPLISSLLHHCQPILTQNEIYAKRFEDLCPEHPSIQVAGSIKFDRLQTQRDHPGSQQLRLELGIDSSKPVLVAGSTGAPEEEMILNVWRELLKQYPDWQLIIAPRHPERFDSVASLISEQGFPLRRRSTRQPAEEASRPTTPAVSLLDTLGELSTCWALADIAFVGGSFNQRGGQNMMEPAGYGAAILLGPNTWNFAEIVSELSEKHGCLIARDEDEFSGKIGELIRNPMLGVHLGQAAQQYVLTKQGATAITIQALESRLALSHDADEKIAA